MGENELALGVPLNGDPARETDIALMEQKASELVSAMPLEAHQQYARETDEGAIITFKTFKLESDPPEATHTGIVLSNGEFNNVQFEINFDPDGTPFLPVEHTQEQLECAAFVAEGLLASRSLTKDEELILREAVTLLVSIEGLRFGTRVPLIKKIEKCNITRLVHSKLLECVTERNPSTLYGREFNYEFPNGDDLAIIEQRLGETAPANPYLAGLPVVQIEYRDNKAQINYCFSRFASDEVELVAYDPRDIVEELEDPTADVGEVSAEEIAIQALMEQWGNGVPGEVHVELLDKKLAEATTGV